MNPKWFVENKLIDADWNTSDKTKTKSGRLIDATAFRQRLNAMFLEEGADQSTLLKVLEELEKMPTIIEAETEGK